MPVAAWRAMIAEHYPGGGWIRLADDTLDGANDRRARRGLPSFDACVDELLEQGAGRDGVSSSRSSSTRCSTRATRCTPTRPGATKNATPTPFGIVYPPAYAAECAGAFDHARLECVAEPRARARR